MFFKKFQPIQYSLDGYSKKAMNILTSAILKRLNIDQNYTFQKYIVKEGEHYDSLALRFYNEPSWGWTILLANSIVDPYTQWPMDLQVLEKFTVSEHGSAEALIEFRYIDTGWVLDDIADRDCRALILALQPLPINVHPVTALEYEGELNNDRRNIVIVSPRYIRQFVDAYNRVIEGK